MSEEPAGGDVKGDSYNLHSGDRVGCQEPMEGWRTGVGCGQGNFTGKNKCEPWQLWRTILSPLQQSPPYLYMTDQAHRQGMRQDAEMEKAERTYPGSSVGLEVISGVEAKA